MKKVLFLISMLGLPALAFAASGHSTDADNLYYYYKTIADWASGGLGAGLATTMLLMGGAVGVAKCSPMPTLSGVAGAAFLHWAPAILLSLVTPPQVTHPAVSNPTTVAAVSASHATAVMPLALASKVASTQPTQAMSAPATPLTAHHVSAKPVSSSDLVMWMGIAGAAVFLSLTASFVFLASRRKSKDLGFMPGAAAGVSPAFTDPNGFQRGASPA
jgi:conjugal transfer pilus assembly protein TraA